MVRFTTINAKLPPPQSGPFVEHEKVLQHINAGFLVKLFY